MEINRFLSKKEVRAYSTLSPSHIDRLEKDGKFPKRILIGKNRVAWLQSEIIAWMDEKVEASRKNDHRRKL